VNDNNPITPGEILKEDFLDPLGISQNALARALGTSPRSINEIVLGRRAITARMAIRLGAYFGQSPRYWLNIQSECDYRKAMRDEPGLSNHIEPLAIIAEPPGAYGE
jgi:addiction module HigA family antidote